MPVVLLSAGCNELNILPRSIWVAPGPTIRVSVLRHVVIASRQGPAGGSFVGVIASTLFQRRRSLLLLQNRSLGDV